MSKMVALNNQPILMCYSYLSNMFSVIPFNIENDSPIFHAANMEWNADSHATKNYKSIANNAVIRQDNAHTYVLREKYSPKIYCDFYNEVTGNCKFVVNILDYYFSEPYAFFNIYINKKPGQIHIENELDAIIEKGYMNDMIKGDINLYKLNKFGFCLHNNGERTLLDSLDNPGKNHWLAAEVKDGILSFSHSTDGNQWETVYSENIDTQKYEIGLQTYVGEEQSYPWLFSNFIQIYMPLDLSTDDLPLDYYFPQRKLFDYSLINPFFDYENIPKKLINRVPIDIIDLLRNSIDMNIPINVHLNEFYVENRAAFGCAKYDHENLLFGYDDAEQVFYLQGYDSGALRRTKIKYENFMQAFDTSDYPDTITLLRPNVLGFVYKLDINTVVDSLEEYLSSYDSRKSNQRIMQDGMHIVFGHSIYNNILCNDTNMSILLQDQRITHFLYEHKGLMALRVEYLHAKGYIPTADYPSIAAAFNKITFLALTLRNLVIKNMISKNEKNVLRIADLLSEIRDLEYVSLKSLLDLLPKIKRRDICERNSCNN